MAEIGIKELKATASAVIERVEGGTAYVVTKRGRPAAVGSPAGEPPEAASLTPSTLARCVDGAGAQSTQDLS